MNHDQVVEFVNRKLKNSPVSCDGVFLDCNRQEYFALLVTTLAPNRHDAA